MVDKEFVARIRIIVERMLLDMKKRWWWFLVAAVIYIAHLFWDDWILSIARSALARARSANYPTIVSSVGLWIVNALPTNHLLVLLGAFLVVVLGFFVHAYFETRPPAHRTGLHCRFVNSCIFPDLSRATMLDMLETDAKRPGWENRPIGWEWFMEIQVVNGSPVPLTIESIEAKATLDGKDLPTKITSTANYWMDMKRDQSGNSLGFQGKDPVRQLPDLAKKIISVVLTQGVGYRGWLHVDVGMLGQGDITRALLNVWLVDSFGEKHEVDFIKEEEKSWNYQFMIFKDPDRHNAKNLC